MTKFSCKVVRMTELERGIRKRLSTIARRIWDEGLTGKTSLYIGGGNISMRIPETDQVLIFQ